MGVREPLDLNRQMDELTHVSARGMTKEICLPI